MSDPRMIPADEAQRVLDKISRGLTITYLDVPGLAHTVVEQDARIEQLDTEVVRLRRALEDLIRQVGTEDHYPPADDWERGVDAAYRDVTDTLTHILEGHTDV